ncbi:arylamine N-acetyltransferase family protein [Mycolicibacterium litorale]|uniref:Arylamine N-acetyltransferase n=1 Tax=Mycolicibacterium litorale TaxID=758802 RepID=A0AAD1IM26_9MYCO|nr:arylamine N-acetyltransferase [Mycolicibacterium litorale]MCV7417145.1 arylamine N-acetyltransferase [Mycolicibacterium litorale]TDY04933.1 arylamine N-acetyltransferase [Mycolicibacterium litorale]BBY18362.1 arylamine N-acetyltransferase [Mycolicibacterium litorale]
MTVIPSYFARIGYGGEATPSLDTLHALVAAHNRSIPFENLDPLLGIPVADLSAAALADKLVHRRRGGYCYEHNGLMGYALEELGFGVERLAARVVWMRDEDTLPAQTHQLLAVTVPDVAGRFLVDVGFGGQTPSAPLRFDTGVEQATRHEPYRIREHRDGQVLEAHIRGAWLPLYVFTDDPQPLIDLEVGSWYVSTHPASPFVGGLTAALVTDDARWNMRGRHLTVHRADGSERIRFDTAGQVLDTLAERFGIDLTDLGDRADVEKRVHEVLDT